MKVELLEGKSAYKTFSQICSDVYKGNKFYRGTESSVEKMLLSNKSSFSSHSKIKLFVIRDNNNLVARFALIDDYNQPEHLQLSFFEAMPNLGNIYHLIKNEAIKFFPNRKKMVIGLNGHLNYGAGILLNCFNEPPLFGLPYNHNYYADYFKGLACKKMLTFRFSMEVYNEWAKSYLVHRKLSGLKLRFMDKSNIKNESAIYTMLNNKAFAQHPFWANRDVEEDIELFYPFRYLLNNENLIFAEVNGKPVGFFLWYPDFNQLVDSQRDLNLIDVIKYRLGKKIDTFRFTEIGIIPEYRKSPVALALINKSLPALIENGYKYCEGGFIYEENKASINFVKRILQRCYGKEAEPNRIFATYEDYL